MRIKPFFILLFLMPASFSTCMHRYYLTNPLPFDEAHEEIPEEIYDAYDDKETHITRDQNRHDRAIDDCKRSFKTIAYIACTCFVGYGCRWFIHNLCSEPICEALEALKNE